MIEILAAGYAPVELKQSEAGTPLGPGGQVVDGATFCMSRDCSGAVIRANDPRTIRALNRAPHARILAQRLRRGAFRG